jgi:uncharacterized membrane protein
MKISSLRIEVFELPSLNDQSPRPTAHSIDSMPSQTPLKKRQSKTPGTAPVHWFLRGMLGGVLLITACNAGSYFFRTQSVADLIDGNQNVTESLGFPVRVWLEDSYPSHPQAGFDFSAAGINLCLGILIGSVFGAIGISFRRPLNQKIADFEKKNSTSRSKGYQFSIIGLLLLTTLIAVLTSTIINYLKTPQLLLVIYFAGPAILLGLAMIPRGMHWRFRVVILAIAEVGLIGMAMWYGHTMGVPTERVMLGIFVGWTSQSGIFAFLITVGLLIHMMVRESPFEKNDNDRNVSTLT